MHLFLICFTLLCSVFRISMKLDIYEDAHCCTYCERNRTKRLLRHVTLNMAFLGITSRCNSHVRSLMKGRRQKVFFSPSLCNRWEKQCIFNSTTINSRFLPGIKKSFSTSLNQRNSL